MNLSRLKPTRHRLQGTAVGVAIAAAIFGGSYAAKELVHSDAAQTAFNLQVSGPVGVPYLGPFAASPKHGTVCGPAVRLMEGALRNTTPPIRKTPPARCVGPATTRQIQTLQRRHHLPPSGIYGARTHAALAHAYSKRQRLDLTYLVSQRADKLKHDTVLVVTKHAYEKRTLMHYCGSGAYNGHLRNCFERGVWPAWPDVPRHTDCSGYVSWVLYQAGAGYISGSSTWPPTTQTLARLGTRVPVGSPLRIGDVILYGYNNSHTAIYIGGGLVSSHGQPGIDIRPVYYRPVYGIRRIL